MNHRLVNWLLGLAIILVLGVCYQVSRVAPAVAKAIADAITKAKQDKMSEIQWPSWVSGGKTFSIKSVRENGEDTEDFLDRATAEYLGMQKRFPPDQSGSEGR